MERERERERERESEREREGERGREREQGKRVCSGPCVRGHMLVCMYVCEHGPIIFLRAYRFVYAKMLLCFCLSGCLFVSVFLPTQIRQCFW